MWTHWDTEWLKLLNGQWSPGWDAVWLRITDQHFWWWLYITLVAWISYKLPALRAILLLLLVGGMLALNDQLINLIKAFTGRLRPCNRPDLQQVLHILKCSHQYSFFSAHAANSFLLVSALYYAVRSLFPRPVWLLLFFWAFLMAYSRLYVGVHFPSDVLTGILEGWLAGYLTASLYRRWEKYVSP